MKVRGSCGCALFQGLVLYGVREAILPARHVFSTRRHVGHIGHVELHENGTRSRQFGYHVKPRRLFCEMSIDSGLVQIGYETIGAAIEVHRHLGPGLLEHVYEACLSSELELRGIPCDRQVKVPVRYKGRDLGSRYRIDLVVANQLIIEIKSVEAILDVHKAQLLSQLRLTGIASGLLINFNVARLHEGIRRAVNAPGLTLTESFNRQTA